MSTVDSNVQLWIFGVKKTTKLGLIDVHLWFHSTAKLVGCDGSRPVCHPSYCVSEELRHAAKVTGIFLAQAPPSDPLTLHQGGGGRNLSLKNSGTRTGENWNDKRYFECMNMIFKNTIVMNYLQGVQNHF